MVAANPSLTLRPARPEEADELTALMLRSLGHWGHDVAFPELVARVAEEDAVTPDLVRRGEFWCLDAGPGATVGFYGLVPREDDVDLTYMFLEPARVGHGHGRRLWEHAVERARATGRPRLRIVSDPRAVGFYAAMGARLERRVEVADGFALGLMWLDLAGGPA